jgi:hypothetical protein
MAQETLNHGAVCFRRRFCLGIGIFLAVSLLAAGLKADPPGSQVPCPQDPPGVPLQEKGSRPATGPQSLAAFIDNLSSNDSAFDVNVSEGRILTTKVDLAVAGKRPALVAVGDPTILDFTIISARQIRVVGRRTGVTDLSIITGDNQS